MNVPWAARRREARIRIAGAGRLPPVNYLAHFYLAEPPSESLVGNLLGDFVPGRPEALAQRLPAGIVAGILRHRAIDAFTDSHPVTAALRNAIPPPRRRFAGAIVDVIYDHFLTRHWAEFSNKPFDAFIDRCNAALLEQRRWLPAELSEGLEERIAAGWLSQYGSEAGLRGVFRRMSRRRPAFAPLAGATDDLRANRTEFEDGFRRFFPDLIAHVAALGPEKPLL